MTAPTRVPPQLPEVVAEPENEAPSMWVALLGLCCVAGMGIGLGAAAWNARSDDSPGRQAQAAIDQVDQTIEWIASERWDSAYEAFDQSCAKFGLSEFRAGFGPVFDSYRSHALSPPQNEPFEVDQIVLVRGTIDLGAGADNALRAELRLAETTGDGGPTWRLCGLRIDES